MTPRFANLREWLTWMADYGATASCCLRMSAEELNERADEGRSMDCGSCEYRARQSQLWPQNAEAFNLYRALCGRTVGLLDLQGWLFLSLTDGMSGEERRDALARLDVIHEVLSPEGAGGRDGRSDPTRHRPE